MCKYGLLLFNDLESKPRRDLMTRFDVKTVNKLKIDKFYRKEIMAIPVTFLINTDGLIIWKHVGTRTERPSNEIIRNAIKSKL